MDLLAALSATPAKAGACKLQRIIDDIPADEPGRDQFLAAVTDGKSWPAGRLAVVIANLGMKCDVGVIQQHRKSTCACFRG